MRTLLLFVALIFLVAGGLLIEVVNPHSFLGYKGAFVRAAVLILAIPLWSRLSSRGNMRLRIPGIVVLSIAGIVYSMYGFTLRRQEALYEKQRAVDAR